MFTTRTRFILTRGNPPDRNLKNLRILSVEAFPSNFRGDVQLTFETRDRKVEEKSSSSFRPLFRQRYTIHSEEKYSGNFLETSFFRS